MIRITVDPREVLGHISLAQQRHLPYAVGRALTMTGKVAQREITDSVPRIFNQPVALTKSGIRLIPVKTERNKFTVVIYIRDEASKGTPPSKYLQPEIEGGTRRIKRFERQLQWSGLMAKGMVAVPTSFAPLDSYGNLPAGFIVRMLTILRSWNEQGYKANETDKGAMKRKGRMRKQGKPPTDFFAAGPRDVIRNHGPMDRRGFLPQGIYQRTETRWGSAIRPILLFVKQANYKPRFPFVEMVEGVHARDTAANLRAAWAEALRTAR